MRHDLKCWPAAFEALISGKKHHEIRKNDRGFEVGDELLLREWDPDPSVRAYTRREHSVIVTYISRSPDWGLPDGMVVMSIENAVKELRSWHHWNLFS